METPKEHLSENQTNSVIGLAKICLRTPIDLIINQYMSTLISFLSQLTLILLFLPLAATAQIRAVTTTGEEVILNSDGTWRYVNDSATLAEKSGHQPCRLYPESQQIPGRTDENQLRRTWIPKMKKSKSKATKLPV